MMLPNERVRHEQALRRAVLAGDQTAWRTLYDGAYLELWNYVVWRSAGLRDLAEEITQETWLVAVRRIRDFDPVQGSFIGWTRGIAAKVLNNHLRSRRLKIAQRLDDRELTQPLKDPDPSRLIAQALAELPEHYEAVLRAKYLDALSVDEIAADWDETAKAIESLLTRARKAFRETFERLSGQEAAFKEIKP